MSGSWILAIDQGTHASRAIAFTPEGKVAAQALQEVALFRRSEVVVEQDPLEILKATRQTIQQVVKQSGASHKSPGPFAAAGLATQRSSVVAWNRQTGQPLSPVISWQDRRHEEDLLSAKEIEPLIKQKSGLVVSPHYGANKLRRLIQTSDAVKEAHQKGALAFGPLVSWLLFHLLEGSPFVVDHANASRTLLWNLTTREWDEDLLTHFEIPREALPECRPIVSEYGLLKDCPISCRAVSGDQNAALYARGEPLAGEIFANIGTGAFILQPVEGGPLFSENLLSGINFSEELALKISRRDDDPVEQREPKESAPEVTPEEVAWAKQTPGDETSATADPVNAPNKQTTSQTDAAERVRYHIEGTVNGGAAALEWYFKRQKTEKKPSPEEIATWLQEYTSPPLFLNTIGGLGSPWWRPGGAPRWVGPDQNLVEPSTPEAVCSIAESIVFMLAANFEEMKRSGAITHDETLISISGGLAAFDEICQKLATLTGAKVQRYPQSEATARGVAWLANPLHPDWRQKAERVFEPGQEGDLQERFRRFKDLIARAANSNFTR